MGQWGSGAVGQQGNTTSQRARTHAANLEVVVAEDREESLKYIGCVSKEVDPWCHGQHRDPAHQELPANQASIHLSIHLSISTRLNMRSYYQAYGGFQRTAKAGWWWGLGF